MSRSCGKLFLDSGAHTIFNRHVLTNPNHFKYEWYVSEDRTRLSKAYRKYMDRYAAFVNEHWTGIDHYVTVDAIYDPAISWTATEYLKHKHGLWPIPVIHHKTPLSWIDRYVKEGHKIIGVGGLGQDSTKQDYIRWADRVFRYLCPPPHYKPVVRIHGFAVTTYQLLLRYPWWSVDSSSWAKAAGFGNVIVPHRRGGVFDFSDSPYIIGASTNSRTMGSKGRHYAALNAGEQAVVQDWLNKIEVPLGRVDEGGKTVYYGVMSEYNARAVANLKFFVEMAKWLGNYPRKFTAKTKSRLDESDVPVLDMPPVKDSGRPTHIAFSGGSPIPEANLDRPAVMLSFITNVNKTGRPDSRFRKLMKARRLA